MNCRGVACASSGSPAWVTSHHAVTVPHAEKKLSRQPPDPPSLESGILHANRCGDGMPALIRRSARRPGPDPAVQDRSLVTARPPDCIHPSSFAALCSSENLSVDQVGVGRAAIRSARGVFSVLSRLPISSDQIRLCAKTKCTIPVAGPAARDPERGCPVRVHYRCRVH